MKFYSHLIDMEEVIVELSSLKLSESEKKHLSSLIDSSLHQTILELCLSKLSDEDKRIFINHLTDDEHDKAWDLLNSKVDKIAEQIKQAAQSFKADIKRDIREVK